MAANVYECLFLLDPNKVAGDVPRAAEQLKTVLEKNHAEILASRQWDERRLAYPIKNHKKGLYYLMYYRTEGKNLVGIEQDFRLVELVLRYMTIKIEPKLVDKMLTVALDEHALALQMAPESGDDIGDGDDMRGGRGPRGPRGRRDFEGGDR